MNGLRIRLSTPPRFGLLTVVLLAPLLSAPGAARAGGFEQPNPLRSATYLSADQLAGPDFKVEPEATTDGFATTYTVTSRFGTFQAHGRMQVALRIREIQALAQLEEVSKTDVFKDAVKSSATAPLELAQAVAEKPVETLKGIPSGVGRWMRKTSFQVKEGYQDAKDLREDKSAGTDDAEKTEMTEKAKVEAKKYGLNYLKISGAELAWYAKLGVDPYTDNEMLRKAVSSVARVQGLTTFAMKFAGLPSIPGAREARKTMDLVWKTDPTTELRMANRKKLLAAGISEATARQFEDNGAFSPSHQTALVQSLGDLAGVKGETLVARAIAVASREEAATLTSSVALMARFHKQQSPLAEFLPGALLPVARTEKGELIAVMYSDALFWTAEVGEAARGFADIYRAAPAQVRQLWVVGAASQAFKDGACEIGWEVRDRWQSAAPEDASPPAAAGAAR